MGIILSRLRAKPSTKELLEDLEKEIELLEEYRRSTEQQHKKVVGSLIFYFILFFILGSAIFVLYYYPALTTTKEKIIYSVPLLAVPILFFALKRFLQWYFTQKIKYNEENLSQLKRRRRSLLDYAMETETYKVVRELLEKYDPDYYKRVFEATPAIEAPPPSAPLSMRGSFGEVELKKRTPPKTAPAHVISPSQAVQLTNAAVRSPLPAMPRPLPPRERTLVDRIVDYLVGEGPSNRYALICRQCHSHNGMALKEEFEFVAFRCCYCFHWNPQRNQQQQQPRLPLPAPPPSSSSSSEADLSSPSEMPTTANGKAKIEELNEDDEVSNSSENAIMRKSGPDSPTLRRRLVPSPEEEINAVLEEDRTSGTAFPIPTDSH